MNPIYDVHATREGQVRPMIVCSTFGRRDAKKKAAHLRLQGYEVDIFKRDE